MPSSPTPPAAQTPAPPPPPAADAPQTPAFNESATKSINAQNSTVGARRGTNSLRIDLQNPAASSSTGTGLQI